MDVFCVLFLLSSLSRLSAVSVVFDFSDSPNDVAPASLIMPPVGRYQKTHAKLNKRLLTLMTNVLI